MMTNQATLIGRLGSDPQVNYAGDGGKIANLSIATDESFKNAAGERVKRTEWHRVVCFGKVAEIASDYLGKGRLIGVQGKLRTRKWTDKDKIDRYTTEIVADEIKMLDSGMTAQKSAEPQTTTPIDDIPF